MYSQRVRNTVNHDRCIGDVLIVSNCLLWMAFISEQHDLFSPYFVHPSIYARNAQELTEQPQICYYTSNLGLSTRSGCSCCVWTYQCSDKHARVLALLCICSCTQLRSLISHVCCVKPEEGMLGSELWVERTSRAVSIIVS